MMPTLKARLRLERNERIKTIYERNPGITPAEIARMVGWSLNVVIYALKGIRTPKKRKPYINKGGRKSPTVIVKPKVNIKRVYSDARYEDV